MVQTGPITSESFYRPTKKSNKFCEKLKYKKLFVDGGIRVRKLTFETALRDGHIPDGQILQDVEIQPADFFFKMAKNQIIFNFQKA